MDSTLIKHCNIWTKNLTNLPRFSVVNITDYITKYGTDRASYHP